MAQPIEMVSVTTYNTKRDSKNHYMVRVVGTQNILTTWCSRVDLHATVARLMTEVEEHE